MKRGQHLSQGLDQLLHTTKAKNFIERVQRWSQKNFLWPFPMGTLCCGIEGRSLEGEAEGSPLEKWPVEKSDLMIVMGSVTEKLLPYFLEAYEKMESPKWVMAVGACAASGGPYGGACNYSVVPGIHHHIPVDVYVPGCPPPPCALWEGVKMIQERVEKGVCAGGGVRYLKEGPSL